jgi:hypothetical protein
VRYASVEMLTVGIVGLPNAGKSTLFNALTRARQAQVASYPFCTIDPNVAVIEVPDPRLDALAPIFGSSRRVPAAIEFFDIAGLVRGASRGEGLGNRFLGQIREVDAIVEVVRGFERGEVAHVDGSVDPLRDIDTVDTELMLADLETVARRREKVERQRRAGDKSVDPELKLLERLAEGLDRGVPARQLHGDAHSRTQARHLFLLTDKPMVYAVNLAEEELGEAPRFADPVRRHTGAETEQVVALSAELEAGLTELEEEEAREYLEAVGIEERGTDALIRAAFETLALITFFTGNEKEVRARPVPRRLTAYEAAADVHADIQRGFIGAEVIPAAQLIAEGSLHGAKEQGRIRLEGRDYPVQDGDVIQFRFHV